MTACLIVLTLLTGDAVALNIADIRSVTINRVLFPDGETLVRMRERNEAYYVKESVLDVAVKAGKCTGEPV